MEHGTPFNLLLRLSIYMEGDKSSSPLLNATFPRKTVQGEPTFTRVNKTHIRKALAHISHICSVPTDKNTRRCPETHVPEEHRAELSQHFLRNLQTQRKSKGHNNSSFGTIKMLRFFVYGQFRLQKMIYPSSETRQCVQSCECRVTCKKYILSELYQ